MSGFDERKNAQESKFAHDAALKFKAEARRNKLLGEWAAGLMGLEGDKAEAYAKAVIMADLEEAGDEDVFRKLRKDFDEAGIEQTTTRSAAIWMRCCPERSSRLRARANAVLLRPDVSWRGRVWLAVKLRRALRTALMRPGGAGLRRRRRLLSATKTPRCPWRPIRR